MIFKYFALLILTLAVTSTSLAQNSTQSKAAAQKKKKAAQKAKRVTQLPKKKLSVETEDGPASDVTVNSETPSIKGGNQNAGRARSMGADSSEGWIIRKTKDGIIKIPKRETFKFEGGEISGSAQRPSQTVLGSRPSSNRYSLLPERKNYRSDILGSAGAGNIVGNPTSGLK